MSIVCVKIVGECKHDVLSKAVAIQDAYDRVFQLHSMPLCHETRPETRKRPKKWAGLCKAKAGEPWMISSNLGSPLLSVKT